MPESFDSISTLQADAWQRCVNWFAYHGQAGQSGHQVSGDLLQQAEDANPYQGSLQNVLPEAGSNL